MSPVNLDEIVSRALKHPSRSSAAGRRRGRHRAAHLGCPRDSAGHVLAQPCQPVIAIVITDSSKLVAGDPEWIKLIEAITVTCQAQRGLCALYLLNPGSTVPETLYTARLDAVIIVGQPADEATTQIRLRRPATALIEPPATNVTPPERP